MFRERFVLFLAIIVATVVPNAKADGLMSIGQLAGLLDQGPAGKVVAVAYVQGTIEGFLAMDSLLKKEQGKKPEFCRIFHKAETGPVEHPAHHAEFIIRQWQKTGQSMDTLAVDVLLMYMTAQYGCGYDEPKR